LVEGSGAVAGIEQGAGGVGGGPGAALACRQGPQVEAGCVGECGVDVSEVAVDPDPV